MSPKLDIVCTFSAHCASQIKYTAHIYGEEEKIVGDQILDGGQRPMGGGIIQEERSDRIPHCPHPIRLRDTFHLYCRSTVPTLYKCDT